MAVTVTPKKGDRSAHDMAFPEKHASDIEDATFVYHIDPNNPPGGASALDDLVDVNVPTPGDGQVLTWEDGPSGGQWVAADIPAGGTHALDDHSDVNITTPSNDQILSYDEVSGKWINTTPVTPASAFVDLTDVPASYSGKTNNVVAVSPTADGLVFPTSTTDVDRTDLGGTVTARGENAPNELKTNAFDNSMITKWLDPSTTSWITFQFANSGAYAINKYAITSGNDSADRDPKNWTLYGSNDGSNWTSLDTRTGITWEGRSQRKVFTFSNNTTYAYIKLDITLNNGSASYIQLTEIEYIEASLAGNGITFDQIDPYGIHHRLYGSSADDDEFSSDTIANWTQVFPTGNAYWKIANHCINTESWSIASGDIGCILRSLTGWADGHWLETCVRGLGNSPYNYSGLGLVLTDGTSVSSNALLANFWRGSTAVVVNGRMEKGTITNINANGGGAALDAAMLNGGLRIKLKRISSTSYDWYAGPESGGIYYNWGAANYNPGFTPTHGGLFVMNFGSANHLLASFDYFRHMS